MKIWKTKLLAVLLMLVFALALGSCGSSDDSELSGTYVVEGDERSGVSITFTDDRFEFVMPYSEVEMEYNLPGNFYFSGTFSIDDRANVINLNVDENALRVSVQDMVDVLMDYMLTEDPEMAELMEDPEMAAIIMELMDDLMDEMFEDLLQGMIDDFGDLGFRFDGNFDRLYDDIDDIVFVRQ